MIRQALQAGKFCLTLRIASSLLSKLPSISQLTTI
jgi:hypothetical protein